MEEPLIDLEELARELKIAPKTIRNKLSDKTWPIPPIRIGGALRWRPADVRRALTRMGQVDVPSEAAIPPTSPERTRPSQRPRTKSPS
jgi:predicted DNA-binding transcriptional regulator AlpA